MSRLLRRAEALARAAQQRRLTAIAQQARSMFRDASVDVEDARVAVTGKRLLHRWLSDGDARFFLGRWQ